MGYFTTTILEGNGFELSTIYTPTLLSEAILEVHAVVDKLIHYNTYNYMSGNI
jgi:hypothetical protein